MKKILLIGKTSQLGSEIIKDIKNYNFELISFNSTELDITDKKQIKEKIKKIKPDILINTAAYHVLQKCEENPTIAMKVNFIAVKNLAKICKEKNIIFVTYSTDYVFDGEKKVPYNENDSPNPLQVYGLSKLAGEYAALYSNLNNTFIIRTNGLYGGKKGSIQKNGNFVLNIMKAAKNKKTIEVASDQIVSPTYAGDLSKATLELLSKNAEPGIYHLVNEGFCSWYEFTKEIFQQANIKTKVLPVERRGFSSGCQRPDFSALENTKAKEIRIELSHWKDGLKSYIKHLTKI
jgi:dTDP-4-dehydrorhamnose reductase